MKFILENENTDMSERNIFEQAARGKYRFPFRGLCTVEDLWDLNVTNLDLVFKELNRQKKNNSEESLLDTRSNEDVVLDDMIEIVKHIVSVKQKEQTDRLLAKEQKEKEQRIMDIIKRKENEELENMSIAELTNMIKKQK